MLILPKESNVRIWEHYMAYASTLLFQEYPEHMDVESTFSNSTMKSKRQGNIFSLLRDSKNAKISQVFKLPAYVCQQLKLKGQKQSAKSSVDCKRFFQFSLFVNLVGGNQGGWVWVSFKRKSSCQKQKHRHHLFSTWVNHLFCPNSVTVSLEYLVSRCKHQLSQVGY